MKILVVEPLKLPYEKDIPATLEAMQKLVGGPIEAIYPFADEQIALIANEEGKLLGLPCNRGLFDADGNLCDIVCGTFFLCAAAPDKPTFDSLSEEQLHFCAKRFARIEIFLEGR